MKKQNQDKNETELSPEELAEQKKRPYSKPEIQSESLMAFGALCNGTAGSGRKATTGAPNFCSSTKLLS